MGKRSAVVALVGVFLVFAGIYVVGPPAEAAGGIEFTTGPGTGAPPRALGGLTLENVPDSPSTDGTTISKIGSVSVGPSVEVAHVPSSWRTWSHGYQGEVYADFTTQSLTISLPSDTMAFGFYVEPNEFQDIEFAAVSDNGTKSGNIMVQGQGGAEYFGFFSTTSSIIRRVTVSGGDNFAVGELQVHRGPVITPPARNTYVAMGDSYSSGEGDGSYYHGTDTRRDECHRSFYAYSQVLARRIKGMFSPDEFAACSGAETYDLFHANHADKSEGAQADLLTRRTRIMTLTIGGNDAGFSSVMDSCIKRIGAMQNFGCSKRGSVTHPLTLRLEALRGQIRYTTPEHLPILSILATIEKMHRDAPNAAIYIAGYPNLFGSSPKHFPVDRSAPGGRSCRVLHSEGIDGWIAYSDAQWLNQQADTLNKIISNAVSSARRVGIDVTYVAPRFSGHGLCDTSTSWINPVTLVRARPSPGSLHPTIVGQSEGYADAFLATTH